MNLCAEYFINFSYKCGVNQYNKITENIYLGDKNAAGDKNFIKNMDVVVNCSKNIPFIDNTKINYRIPLDDDRKISTIIQFIYYYKILIPKLNKHIKNGKKIFIHCRCGIQRSANLVSALLIYSKGYKPKEAFNYVKSKRNIVFFPLNNYRLSVEKYYNIIKNI